MRAFSLLVDFYAKLTLKKNHPEVTLAEIVKLYEIHFVQFNVYLDLTENAKLLCISKIAKVPSVFRSRLTGFQLAHRENLVAT